MFRDAGPLLTDILTEEALISFLATPEFSGIQFETSAVAYYK